MSKNGESPVHKAARKGNVEVVIALVAYGADINILSLSGESALEVAVKKKNENLVALFYKLGAEACLQDWTWTMGETSKKEDYIVDLLIEQSSRYPGYKYGHVAALRKYSEKAIPLATQAIKKERTIEIFAMTKFESDGHYTLIFECVHKKIGKRRRKHWKEKGFESQMPEYFTSVEPVYQLFRAWQIHYE